MLLLMTWLVFVSFGSFAEEGAFLEEKDKELWEEEAQLKVQKNFPQYRKNFNLMAIQKKVQKEFVQQEKQTEP